MTPVRSIISRSILLHAVWLLTILVLVSWFARLLVAQNAPGAAAPAASASDDDAGKPEESTSPDEPADAADEELPRLEDLQLPTYDEFLEPGRRDWVVLKDNRVLVVEPVYPRPDTLGRMQTERDEILADSTRRFSDEGKQRLADLLTIDIFLPTDDGANEFRLKIDEILEIRHHEDLMLRRVDELTASGDTRRAFELLFMLARNEPTWPGLEERQIALQATDAARFLTEGQGERALSLIGALYERDPLPPRTGALLGQAAELLIGGAIDREQYREARFELARLKQIDPQHVAIETWTRTLTERARALQTEAEAAATRSDDAAAAVLIDKAAWVWPRLDGLRPVHARLTGRHQRLLVGVPQLASATPLALPTVADRRIDRLTTADLFEVEGFAAVPAYRSLYLDRWEPRDLGRRARFELRPVLPHWASRPPLIASDVIRLLSERMTPGTAAFDTRFADLVESLQPSGPFAFEVQFRRIPLRAEAAMTAPRFAPSPRSESSNDALFRRFAETARAEDEVVYRRTKTLDGGGGLLAEVVERRYADYEEAFRAFDRGEIRLLTDVPSWDVPELVKDKRYVVTKMALPATHLLQFHPDSQPFKVAELRRAVALSTDAADVMRLVAGTGTAETARLVTAPYPSSHLGYDPLVKSRTVDLPLALALTLAAEQRFDGTLPEIVFAAPSESPNREAAESLAAAWKRIGLPVVVRTYEELGPDGRWDLAYREISMADPVVSLAPLITLDPTVEVATLTDLPDWLRQRLLDLERAGDAATAQAILIDLHRQLHADVRCVPLFEVDRFLVSRGAIRGTSDQPVAVYQFAERWSLPHDYPPESP